MPETNIAILILIYIATFDIITNLNLNHKVQVPGDITVHICIVYTFINYLDLILLKELIIILVFKESDKIIRFYPLMYRKFLV